VNAAAFGEALLDPGRPVPYDVSVRPGAEAAHRFGVHRNNVVASLVDALAETYPVVLALVGKDFFRACAREFVRLHPPTSPVLADYGDRWPPFLASFAPAASLPYLPDVARLEWLRQQAMCAADAHVLTAEGLTQGVDGPSSWALSRWPLHPSVGCLRSAHPVVSIWAAHQHADEADTVRALADVSFTQGESALVVRCGWNVWVSPLTPGEGVLLDGLQDGQTLPDALARVETAGHSLDLPFTLSRLLQLGVFVADAGLPIRSP
jgi:hypothetical protein